MKQTFRVQHIPHYSMILWQTLQQPLLIYLALTGNFIMLVSAYAFFQFESPVNPNVTTYFDAVWWAMSTVATVGYGDITPVTIYGRLTAMFLMTCGILFFVGFTAVLVSIMTTLVERDMNDQDIAIKQELANLSQKLSEIQRRLDEK